MSSRSRRPIPLKRRFSVFARCNFKCVYCGRNALEVKLVIDHIYPHSLGGTDGETNLVASCSDCNLGKSDSILEEVQFPPGLLPEIQRKIDRTWSRIPRRVNGFAAWLRKQTWRDDPIGDLARDVRRSKRKLPQTNNRYILRSFFMVYGWRHVMAAFYSAWREFNGSVITKEFMYNLRKECREEMGYDYSCEGYEMKVESQ